MRKLSASEQPIVIAPDGSEIRELLGLRGGGMAHCTLPPGAVTQAVRHRTVEELWFFVGGRGQVWRSHGGAPAEPVDVGPGDCVDVPLGVHFQFRNPGDEPLVFVIATMPPWPGADEAVPVDGYWPTA